MSSRLDRHERRCRGTNSTRQARRQKEEAREESEKSSAEESQNRQEGRQKGRQEILGKKIGEEKICQESREEIGKEVFEKEEVQEVEALIRSRPLRAQKPAAEPEGFRQARILAVPRSAD